MRTARVKRSVMLLKTLIGVAIFAGTTVAAVGTNQPDAKANFGGCAAPR
jgi:hypothetical protein